MIPMIIGVILAVVFRTVAVGLFGADGIVTQIVFWSLIAGGASFWLIRWAWRCLPCEAIQSPHHPKWMERLCHNVPCND